MRVELAPRHANVEVANIYNTQENYNLFGEESPSNRCSIQDDRFLILTMIHEIVQAIRAEIRAEGSYE